ncbi:tRNA lysidine(34) synthetase TilS [Yunchengibacter salinarum]|uniref:tRNA lysidine(34) synthetase TilS n=1 Tax=Yunchengibacter salinarum TaxID=3133399 RepID=UPI0035B60F05
MNPADLARRLTALGLPHGADVALAVSGGPDSLALMHLAAALQGGALGTVTVLTVDHGLRCSAASEAAFVAGQAAALGLAHHTLKGATAPGNVQQEARRLRYDRMAAWCCAAGVGHLLTAHHRDDQAETLLLRLARGSGVDGLAGMAPARPLWGGAVWLLRPLLDVPRSSLAAVVRAAGVQPVADPSNENPQFARTHARRLLADPVVPGMEAARLAETAARLRGAHNSLLWHSLSWLDGAWQPDGVGAGVLDPARLSLAPYETVARGLGLLLRWLGGREHPPRRHKLDRLIEALNRADFTGATLAGVRLLPINAGQGGCLMVREAATMPVLDLPRGLTCLFYDRRYRLDWPGGAGFRLAPLGETGRLALRDALDDGRAGAAPDLPPAPVTAAQPGLWFENTLVGAPTLDYVGNQVPDGTVLHPVSWANVRKNASAGLTMDAAPL